MRVVTLLQKYSGRGDGGIRGNSGLDTGKIHHTPGHVCARANSNQFPSGSPSLGPIELVHSIYS